MTKNSFRRVASLAAYLATLVLWLLQQPRAYAQVSPVDGMGGAKTFASELPSAGDPDSQATVDLSTGAVQASFQFDLPKARGDAQPSLALSYNSSTSTGFAGWGWTLSVPAITRGGVAGVPSFTDVAVTAPSTLATDYQADDYYINGQLLIAICTVSGQTCAGPAGASGASPAISGEVMPATLLGQSLTGWTYFKTQVDDGARYFFSADGHTWLQQLKSGRVRLYGNALDALATTLDSGLETPNTATLAAVGASFARGPAYRWYLTRDADSSGNTVYYSWTNNASIFAGYDGAGYDGPAQSLYLSDIYDTVSPGANFSTGTYSFAHHVHLWWTPILTTESNPLLVPYAIWHQAPAAILSMVDITSATWLSTTPQLVRRYQLNYNTNAWNTTHQLTSIQLLGECPTPQPEQNGFLPQTLPCTPPVRTLRTYGYSADAPSNASSKPFITTLSNISDPAWGPWSGASVPGGPYPANPVLVDINGDAAADLVFGALDPGGYTNGSGEPGPWTLYSVTSPLPASSGGSASPLSLSTSNPSNLQATIYSQIYSGSSQLVFGDWLSDGHPDWLIIPETEGGQLVGNPSQAEVYTPSSSGLIGSFATQFTFVPQPHDTNPSLYPTWSARYAVDADGDGLTDMALWPDPSMAPANATLWTNLTTRDRQGITWPFSKQVGAHGAGTPASSINPKTNSFLSNDTVTVEGDVTGDGLPDIVVL